ncbi:hypothetical protein FY557_12735 [Chryseobacterium sp. SN22]|uniref:hypothetical protein n=1 Tax=Chryseobacterium sp. SN22 TaxID=2606431 RepID=UPI0011F06B16|nr:hypothetical protein [Chryseobacterium sp. SN22]KAA0127481.1 hypothetical protein FY557_12735 [Chryseobacterium sp. SN22]
MRSPLKMLTLLLVFVSGSAFAQLNDVEERDDNFIMENNKNILKIDIKEPLLQVAVKGCKDFKAAEFEDGIPAYKEMLRKYMYVYLNTDFYVLNGGFTFILTVNEKGKVTRIEGIPKVANSKVFFEDMKYVVRRIKKNWIPAICNGQPVTSQIKINMNLSSIATDI